MWEIDFDGFVVVVREGGELVLHLIFALDPSQILWFIYILYRSSIGNLITESKAEDILVALLWDLLAFFPVPTPLCWQK